jgi:hypothetical protein
MVRRPCSFSFVYAFERLKMDDVADRVKKLKFSKRIFLITDGKSAMSSVDQLDTIADMLKSIDVKINIIGALAVNRFL